MSSDEERRESEWRARIELTRALYRKATLEREEAEIAKLKPLPKSEIHATRDNHNSPDSGVVVPREFPIAVELDRPTDLRTPEAIASIMNEKVTLPPAAKKP